jgi:hypothetical protein
MQKKITVLLFFIFCFFAANSQDYDMGIGAKIGMAPGISVKRFITTDLAGEAVLTYRWQGVNLTGLAEFHVPVFDTEGMNFFYGGGIHIGVWDSGLARDLPASGHQLNMGIDGIVGLEYSFRDVPFLIGMDWKPNFNIFQDSRLIIDEISLVLRYIIR